jgi:hypothetical protein
MNGIQFLKIIDGVEIFTPSIGSQRKGFKRAKKSKNN